MVDRSPDHDAVQREPDIDDEGVDRAQIRAMLALAPEDRLRRVEEFVQAAREIRELNAARPAR